MRQFRVSVDIGAPPERVWEVMSDIERWHEWTASVTSIRKLDSGPLRVGARALIRQPKFPAASWKVSALEPGRSFTWISAAPGLRTVAHHVVEPAGRGSRATLSVDMQGIFGRVLARLTKGITERYLRLEADGLKARSETR